MPAPTRTCTIETSFYEDGSWYLRTVVVTPEGTRSGTHTVEGNENMTEAQLKTAVMALY